MTNQTTVGFKWPTLGSCVKSWEGTCDYCDEPYPPETRITSRWSPTRFTIACQCSLDKHVVMEVAGGWKMKTFAAAIVAVLTINAAMAQVVEADNGATFRILGSRHMVGDGWVDPRVSASIADDDGRIHNITFDCAGRYGIMPFGNWHSIPPRSVLARINRIVCK